MGASEQRGRLRLAVDGHEDAVTVDGHVLADAGDGYVVGGATAVERGESVSAAGGAKGLSFGGKVFRKALHLLLAAIMLLAYALVLSNYAKVQQQPAQLVLDLGAEPASARQLDAAGSLLELVDRDQPEDAEQGFALCAWKTLEGQVMSQADAPRSAEPSVVVLYSTPAASVNAASSWVLAASDAQGCVLTSQTAFELFGSSQVAGQNISFDGSDYAVRTVVDSPLRFAVLPYVASMDTILSGGAALGAAAVGGVGSPSAGAGAGSGAASAGGASAAAGASAAGVASDVPVFDWIAFEGKSAAQTENAKMLLSGMFPFASVRDTSAYGLLAAVFVALMPALLFLLALGAAVRAVWRIRRWPVLALLLGLVFAALLALFWLLCGFRVEVPLSLIPNRWSDFSFWSDRLGDFSQLVQNLLTGEKPLVERGLWDAFAGAFVWSGIALACLIALLVMKRVWSGASFSSDAAACIDGAACADVSPADAVAAIAGELICALLALVPACAVVAFGGLELAAWRGLLFAVPCYLLIDGLAKRGCSKEASDA